LNAQNYTREAGVRFGDYFTATWRIFLHDAQAYEALFSTGQRGAKITVLKQHISPTLGQISDNIYFTYGYGAHAGFRYSDSYNMLDRTYEIDEYRFMPLIGIDGLIAMEYRVPKFPLVLCIDIKPYFEYSTIQIFNIYLNSTGFSIKYRF
jgi:hypothetical protein